MDYKDYIVITNRQLCTGDYYEQIKKVASLKPYALILREKDLSDQEYMEMCVKVKSICDEYCVLFIVHQRIEIAKELKLRNIHIPFSMLDSINEGDFDYISVSCHSIEEAIEIDKSIANQIVLGTIFETDCKKGLKGKGIEFVHEVASLTSKPIYAIGGIKESNISVVMEAGAKGGCMMSRFMQM